MKSGRHDLDEAPLMQAVWATYHGETRNDPVSGLRIDAPGVACEESQPIVGPYIPGPEASR